MILVNMFIKKEKIQIYYLQRQQQSTISLFRFVFDSSLLLFLVHLWQVLPFRFSRFSRFFVFLVLTTTSKNIIWSFYTNSLPLSIFRFSFFVWNFFSKFIRFTFAFCTIANLTVWEMSMKETLKLILKFNFMQLFFKHYCIYY